MDTLSFKEKETFTIAETACAHEGNIHRIEELVDEVGDTEADAIKFHIFTADGRSVPESEYHRIVDNLSISFDDWEIVIDHARRQGLRVFTDVFDTGSAEWVLNQGVDGVKIHAADVSNFPLLETVARADCPIFLYVGGSTVIEIATAINHLEQNGKAEIALMYGLQNFPTSLEESNLGKVTALACEFDRPIGYASHVAGGTELAVELPSAAVAAGADIIECHVTDDRSAKHVDYISSLEPTEFDKMVRRVRKTEVMVGDSSLSLTDAEREYRGSVKKTIHTTTEINTGERITIDDIAYLRGDKTLEINRPRMEQVVGKYAQQRIPAHKPVYLESLDMHTVAVLACRSESKRLYGKPLQLVGDQPILAHICDRLDAVPNLDQIVLAIADTASQESYIQFAKDKKIEYIVGPEEDVLKRCAMAADKAEADFVVKANTENPFLAYELLKRGLKTAIQNHSDLVVPREPPLGCAADIYSAPALAQSDKQGDDRHHSEFTSRFIIDNSESFQINIVEPEGHLRRPDIRLTVDNPSDLIMMREIWGALRAESETDPNLVPVSAIIEYLDKHPDIREINAHKPDGTHKNIRVERPFMYGEDNVSQ